jgi:hypothetical protein
MVEEQKLLGARLQVDLRLQVSHGIFVNVVSEEGQRHHERHKAPAKIADDPYKFLPLRRCKPLGKVAHHVMENIAVFFYRRMNGKSVHEQPAVFPIGVGHQRAPSRGNNPAEVSIMGLAVG